jgi:hypothetical protein
MKLEFKFLSPVQPGAQEIANIKNALNRNPVERLSLSALVTY